MIYDIQAKFTAYCEGLYYGPHGYSHTKCRANWDKEKAASYTFETRSVDAPDNYVRWMKPWGWAEINGELVCPACFKEAFGVDFRTPTDD